jgi:hypothetical protein
MKLLGLSNPRAFLIEDLSAPPWVVGGVNFHYTIPPAICQEKSYTKIDPGFFLNLCNITYCIFLKSMLY